MQLMSELAPNAIACAARVIYKHTTVDGYSVLTNNAHMRVVCGDHDDLDLPGLPEGRGLVTPHDVPEV